MTSRHRHQRIEQRNHVWMTAGRYPPPPTPPPDDKAMATCCPPRHWYAVPPAHTDRRVAARATLSIVPPFSAAVVAHDVLCRPPPPPPKRAAARGAAHRHSSRLRKTVAAGKPRLGQDRHKPRGWVAGAHASCTESAAAWRGGTQGRETAASAGGRGARRADQLGRTPSRHTHACAIRKPRCPTSDPRPRPGRLDPAGACRHLSHAAAPGYPTAEPVGCPAARRPPPQAP